MTLFVLVVDDEALARARLVRMLSRVPDVQVLGEAATGFEALDRIRELQPDLLLLDVDMPGMDGFGVAETLGAGDVPLVVFTTAHAQHAALAFEADAVDYLLKPVVQERLERALDKVRQRLLGRRAAHTTAISVDPGSSPTAVLPPPREGVRAEESARPGGTAAPLAVFDGGRVLFFDPLLVTRFRADDKYTSFRVDGEEHLLRESLSTLEERLSSFGFLRVHRAELVRVDAVRALEPEPGGALLHLSDGQTVSVSRRFLPTLKQALRLR